MLSDATFKVINTSLGGFGVAQVMKQPTRDIYHPLKVDYLKHLCMLVLMHEKMG
jgi:hypothetical protein